MPSPNRPCTQKVEVTVSQIKTQSREKVKGTQRGSRKPLTFLQPHLTQTWGAQLWAGLVPVDGGEQDVGHPRPELLRPAHTDRVTRSTLQLPCTHGAGGSEAPAPPTAGCHSHPRGQAEDRDSFILAYWYLGQVKYHGAILGTVSSPDNQNCTKTPAHVPWGLGWTKARKDGTWLASVAPRPG